MKQLFFLISLVSMFNCKPAVTEKIATEFQENLHRKWMLVSFRNFSREQLIAKAAFIDFTNKESVAAGMGCNNLAATYAVKAPSIISYSQWIGTEMACTDMNLENEFSKVIKDFVTYKITGHQLTLYNAKNEKMVFTAQDWD